MSSEGSLHRQQRLQVMLDESELSAIDSWRFKYRMPSRAAAIRELIRRGLMTTDDPRQLAVSGAATNTHRSTSYGVIDAADAPISEGITPPPRRSD